ncbi:transposase [Streptomyces lincolnensis]|uniref:transposase n=1 Tax=Streptomyces lincolnensis TaxID=1915 RepID=UPI00379881A9
MSRLTGWSRRPVEAQGRGRHADHVLARRWEPRRLRFRVSSAAARLVTTVGAGFSPSPITGPEPAKSLHRRRQEDQGRRRHVATDTLGLVLAVIVTAASVHDSTGGKRLLDELAASHPSVTKVWPVRRSSVSCTALRRIRAAACRREPSRRQAAWLSVFAGIMHRMLGIAGTPHRVAVLSVVPYPLGASRRRVEKAWEEHPMTGSPLLPPAQSSLSRASPTKPMSSRRRRPSRRHPCPSSASRGRNS